MSYYDKIYQSLQEGKTTQEALRCTHLDLVEWIECKTDEEFLISVKLLQALYNKACRMHLLYDLGDKKITRIDAKTRRKLSGEYFKIRDYIEMEMHHLWADPHHREFRDKYEMNWKDISEPVKEKEKQDETKNN